MGVGGWGWRAVWGVLIGRKAEMGRVLRGSGFRLERVGCVYRSLIR